MYVNGVGVPQDNEEAESWYRKAAKQGCEGAQYILGGLCKKEQNAQPAELVQAHKRFNLAAVAGYEMAHEDMGEIETMMSGE